ncbi:hypothetical protein ACHAPM_006085 [Fusarium culmorum]
MNRDPYKGQKPSMLMRGSGISVEERLTLSPLKLPPPMRMPSTTMTARSSELVFTGKPGDCKPKMYISVKKKVQRENTYLEDAEEDQELLDAFLIQIFQRGLSGPALYWIEKKRLSEETFSEIERRFLEKYQLSSSKHGLSESLAVSILKPL